jgi:arylsulfatase A-like enzyme
MTADEQRLATRLMETYAGFAEHTDYHAGLLVTALEEMGVLDNTLVIYMAGDNGASAEGMPTGTTNEMITLNGAVGSETLAYKLEHIDLIGTPMAYNHYPVGWAHAMCCPYQWTKQVASHWGGTRNGTAIRWPAGIQAAGEVRNQFHHVIDIVPTILECAGLPAPDVVNGITQKPLEGVSMVYTFDDAATPDRHTTQYFEMYGNRGIYHDGWSAVTLHSIPFHGEPIPWEDEVWELYDSSTDWSQAHSVAAEYPEKLAELQQLFTIEAAKYNVFPLDDRKIERLNPAIAGRPT